MKAFIWMTCLIVIITLPLVGIGIAMVHKTNDAYDRGYQAGVDSMSVDKQCAAWLFDSNLKDVKKRMCK